MIARLNKKPPPGLPVFDITELKSESDVEQKLLYPFLTHPTYLGIPTAWVRTKEYMTPTEIDKVAGKRHGYVPDYSVWFMGIPLLIIEAKAPDVTVQTGLREARLYASEINKRYPPEVNPIGFVFASNGAQFGVSAWDSEIDTLIVECADAGVGSAVLSAIQKVIGKTELEKRASDLAVHFQSRRFFNVSGFMGGQARLNQPLGVNEFAEPLFPTLAKYFAANSDETPDDVIDRAYVSTDDVGQYESVLETYLKDRATTIAGNQIRPIVTNKNSAAELTAEVQKFSANPAFFSRVQLVVGAVGSGKSTFIRRYYRRLRSKIVVDRTRWAFINFNTLPPDTDLKDWIAGQFIESFSALNDIDVYDLKNIERVFSHELTRFERGPAKLLAKADPADFARRRATLLEDLMRRAPKFAECITRHYSGEKGFGIVVVFDNVDRRSREQQLAIFEAAQWFKDITRALLMVNLRDSTFEAHRDEPPLDAFANAINFYIRPPRFAQVIRKRLELVLETLPAEVDKQQEYSLSSGHRIRYPATRLGEFLMAIYISLFDRKTFQVQGALEALVAKNVRRALGMFGDIIVSPHISTREITGALLTGGEYRIQEYRIVRALMRGRQKYFNGSSVYVRNILSADPDANRPSNLHDVDILEYLIRNRKSKIDFAQEGYATVTTVMKKMSQLGYDEEDTVRAIERLVNWGLIETESLVVERLALGEAIRVHASGFIHMIYFLSNPEYLIGISPNLSLSSREAADNIGNIWSSQDYLDEITLASKARILEILQYYMNFEYGRRCKRHAFYEENGFGGRRVLSSMQTALQSPIWNRLRPR